MADPKAVQAKRRVLVTAHHRPGVLGVYELGHQKRQATWFPEGVETEVDVTIDDVPQLVDGQVVLDDQGEPVLQMLSELGRLKRNPYLTVRVPPTASELEAEAKRLRLIEDGERRAAAELERKAVAEREAEAKKK